MKRFTPAMLGLSLMIGSAAMSFAAPQKTDAKSATTMSSPSTADPAATTKVKKHHRKHAKKNAAASTSATAPASTPAK